MLVCTLNRKRKACTHGEPSRDAWGDNSKSFLQCLRDAWSEPRHALVFGTHHMYRYLDAPEKAAKCCSYRAENWNNAAERLASHLPPSCYLLLGAAGGVVGMSGSGYPVELERGEGISGLLLPAQLPEGVRVRPFMVYRHHLRFENYPSDWFASDNFKSLVGLPVGDETLDVKCVLWFAVNDLVFDDDEHFMYEVVDDFVASCGARRFALGGAVLDNMTVKDGQKGIDESAIIGGFCFSGDGVRSVSIILQPTVRGTRAVERELTRLKKTSGFDTWDKCSTVGFMFACVARGSKLHGKSNIEADAFARVFPGIPLMGIFGKGEIGVNCVPSNEPVAAKTLDFTCLHGYTTVFVLLCLGKCK
ncbi:F-box only protein 22-like isoform X2 [Amblyomma americanum]